MEGKNHNRLMYEANGAHIGFSGKYHLWLRLGRVLEKGSKNYSKTLSVSGELMVEWLENGLIEVDLMPTLEGERILKFRHKKLPSH